MTALAASTRKSAERATLMLPFRVPPQEWFTIPQAAAVIGLGESAVEKLYDKGAFTGHSHNAGAGHRKHKRILRVALIAYLVKTADYDDESLTDLYCSALPNFSSAALLRIAHDATRLAAR